MNKLEMSRKEINEIDQKMANLFEKRMDAVVGVIEHKMENNLPIFDSSREDFVIAKNAQYIKNDEYIDYYKEFIKFVMENSKKYQRKVASQDIVGYQGTMGAFSYIATKRLFPDYKDKSYPTFEDVFKAVESGEIPVAVVPFENSFTGEVGEVYDLLSKHKVFIHKIYDLKIDQNLVANKGAQICDIKEVFSHKQALMQSREFLSEYDFKLNEYANTALAAKFVAESKNKAYAAVASKETADIFGLEILCDKINTSRQNTTRFIVIYPQKSEDGNRFNATFVTKHNAGALAKVMSIIADAGYSLENIKSRSIESVPWEYYFYIEVVGSLKEEKTVELIEKIKKECKEFKVIGSYYKES